MRCRQSRVEGEYFWDSRVVAPSDPHADSRREEMHEPLKSLSVSRRRSITRTNSKAFGSREIVPTGTSH
jgi:hypothetical protein